jgi:hypothetical protein|tara:strand:- start:501 stop:1496 length:996 start_codon:yes stop_codon:yes gene_type:complete
MSEEKEAAVAEELTEWSEIDTSPSQAEEDKVEFEVEGAEPEPVPEVEAAPEPEKKDIPELDGIETKGAEKRIRQLVQQKKEQAELLAKAEAEKQALIQQLTERDKYTVEASKSNTDTNEKLLQQQIEMAKKAYLDAYDLGEKEKMLEAQELINKGQVDLATLSQQRQAIEQYEAQLSQREQQAQAQQQQQAQPVPQQQANEYDPLAVEWSQKPENSWFNRDQIMTVAALTIDAQLKSEGYDSSTPEFYQEVDKRIRAEFPHKFSEVADSQPAQQVVAGQSRSSTTASTKGKKVKLSQEDVRLAQKWNIPLEKYAAEKARADRAAGEYVPVG